MTLAKTPFSPELAVSTYERYHGLDAARAIALLVGIFHHGIESLVSYAKWDWITQDSQSSIALDIIFYASHVFRMQAFFLMSGFFAHMLVTRKGMKDYIVNRAKRLVLPFVLFWPVLYAITCYMWIWGIQYLKHIPFEEAATKLPNYMVWSNGFPLMHMWFLYFLILFCICVVLFKPIVDKIDRKEKLRQLIDKFIGWCMNHKTGSIVIGLIMSLPMLGMRDWFGVDTSASGLIPRIAPFILYGAYFILGWFLCRQRGLINNFIKFRKVNFVTGMVLILTLIVLNLSSKGSDPSLTTIVQASINFIYAFASITTVFAFIGYMLLWFNKPSTSIRYLSDASYWGYLIHLPLIGFFQILVAQYEWFWGLKLALVFIPSVILLWVSYRYVVRNTGIGVLLNGKIVDRPLSTVHSNSATQVSPP